jgi:hypothetical protein
MYRGRHPQTMIIQAANAAWYLSGGLAWANTPRTLMVPDVVYAF